MKKFLIMLIAVMCTFTTAIFAGEVQYTAEEETTELVGLSIDEKGTSELTVHWPWSNGDYTIDGSSNGATLYTNYYFDNVVGKSYRFTSTSGSI